MSKRRANNRHQIQLWDRKQNMKYNEDRSNDRADVGNSIENGNGNVKAEWTDH